MAEAEFAIGLVGRLDEHRHHDVDVRTDTDWQAEDQVVHAGLGAVLGHGDGAVRWVETISRTRPALP